jgi:hypothetical protein
MMTYELHAHTDTQCIVTSGGETVELPDLVRALPEDLARDFVHASLQPDGTWVGTLAEYVLHVHVEPDTEPLIQRIITAARYVVKG